MSVQFALRSTGFELVVKCETSTERVKNEREFCNAEVPI